MCKCKLGVIDWIAVILVIIGAINWGLAVFGWNLVDMLFGAGVIAKVIYALVGLSGLCLICFVVRVVKCNCSCGSSCETPTTTTTM